MLVVLGQKKQKKKIGSLEGRITLGVADRKDGVGVDMHVQNARNCTHGMHPRLVHAKREYCWWMETAWLYLDSDIHRWRCMRRRCSPRHRP